MTNLTTLRIDQTGSLMRPPELQHAFEQHKAGQIDDEDLRRVQDTWIPQVISEQERHGLPVVSDGELRRTGYMDSFSQVRGWEWGERMFQSRSSGPKPVTQRLELVANKPLLEYRFAMRTATQPVKVALVNVDHLRGGFQAEESRSVYAGIEEFEADLVRISRQMVAELVEAGCRYIQIDGPSYAFRFIDPQAVERLRAQGEDLKTALQHAIDLDNAMIASFDGVTFGMHVCRGNNAGGIPRSGSYDAIAEQLFSGLHHQRLLLEYDDFEREGDFSPLRFVPRDKTAVLGIITTKAKRVESPDEIKRRVDEAARYLPLDQLAISPQCGFRHGGFNPADYPQFPGEDEQWRKLDVMMETASAIWGVAE